MADVYAVFGTLLAVAIVFPGLLASYWLLFPKTVERARLRLDTTPWRCLLLGFAVAVLDMLPILVLLSQPNGAAKLAGWTLLLATLAVAPVGAAGIAAKMGSRLAQLAEGRASPTSCFVRGAVTLELAAAFPILGWLIVLPCTLIAALGASVFALLRWPPAMTAVAGDPPVARVNV